jgi:hypothetical protein
MKILSVDFDYFLPDLSWMDWGHHESALFIQHLWQLRCGDIHLKTHQSALDYVVPDLERLVHFWDQVLSHDSAANQVTVADSHLSLGAEIISNQWMVERIDNYDQHHDCGYDEAADNSPTIECGNWASKLMRTGHLKKYHLHYPAWRRQMPERSQAELRRRLGRHGSYDHRLPPKPTTYDLIFICRSGGWTPTWCDNNFSDFVQQLLWEFTCDKVKRLNDLNERHPTMEEAIELRETFIKQRREWTSQLKQDNFNDSSEPITSFKK